jgi:signal transduction histidine kinase
MESFRRRTWLAWASVGILGILCAVLAALQYRWIGEISAAERTQLRDQLQSRLSLLSRGFNDQISNACASLLPTWDQVDQMGAQEAYSERYLAWRDSHEPLFRRIGLVRPAPEAADLLLLDLKTGRFSSAEWPADWQPLRARMEFRPNGGPPGPVPESTRVIELPRVGPGGPPSGPRMEERLVVEPDPGYIRRAVLPAYLNRYLGHDYDAEIVAATGEVIYRSSAGSLEKSADASVPLLSIRPMIFAGRRGGRGFRDNRDPRDDHARREMQARMAGGRDPMMPGGGGPEFAQARWLLRVRHHSGSLDALVAQTRVRNLAVSAGILLLILATTGILVQVSRRSQQLANLQMSFVTNVSHELRTPLTVIRTAAFNLRGRLASRPDQVERYGSLIQAESQRLEALVEQVLRFASASAGKVIRDREPVAVESLIEQGLRSSRACFSSQNYQIESSIDPDLPLVLADEVALRQALQNLFDNAIKYGTEGNTWIGVSAAAVSNVDGPAVEIRVKDRGPGIPADEQRHIFDPFYRGRKAVQDQVHGTGLGLNLVKKIVEAHGGTIRVVSEPMQGAEFIVRIPAAPPELQNEFAHTPD